MYLILSGKAAQKLKKAGRSVTNFQPDIYTWRVDFTALEKRSIFIATHEKTLYTCVSSYRGGLGGIIKKIAAATRQDKLDVNDIDFVKFQDRSVTGSMNNMKQMINHFHKYGPSDNEQYEELINRTPFKMLSYRTPAELYSLNTPFH
jgi:3-dehydroquinate dehydratase